MLAAVLAGCAVPDSGRSRPRCAGADGRCAVVRYILHIPLGLPTSLSNIMFVGGGDAEHLATEKNTSHLMVALGAFSGRVIASECETLSPLSLFRCCIIFQ